MEVKGLSDLVKYHGQFIRISEGAESPDILGYLDKTIWIGSQRIVLFFFPIRKADAFDKAPTELTDKVLRERPVYVKKLHPLERLELKIKVEQKEIALTGYSDFDALQLLKQAASISKL